MANTRKKEDPVNPSYYQKGEINTFEYMQAVVEELPGQEATCVAAIIKYISRYKQKNGRIDLLKAQWYLEQLLEIVE